MLLIHLGWRSLFYIFGLMGGPLIAFWMAMVPSTDPKARDLTSSGCFGAHGNTSFGPQGRGRSGVATFRGGSRAGTGPVAPSTSIGVKELLSKSATWAIVIVNIVNHWGYFIYLNWMPSYFNAVGSSSILTHGHMDI